MVRAEKCCGFWCKKMSHLEKFFSFDGKSLLKPWVSVLFVWHLNHFLLRVKGRKEGNKNLVLKGDLTKMHLTILWVFVGSFEKQVLFVSKQVPVLFIVCPDLWN